MHPSAVLRPGRRGGGGGTQGRSGGGGGHEPVGVGEGGERILKLLSSNFCILNLRIVFKHIGGGTLPSAVLRPGRRGGGGGAQGRGWGWWWALGIAGGWEEVL